MKDLQAHPYRRELLKNPTEAEKKFRVLLKGVVHEYPDHLQKYVQFATQVAIRHPRGFYIVDFYMGRIWLAFEIDGGYHWQSTQLHRDLARDAVLFNQKRVFVRHIPNDDLLTQRRRKALREKVRHWINAAINRRLRAELKHDQNIDNTQWLDANYQNTGIKKEPV